MLNLFPHYQVLLFRCIFPAIQLCKLDPWFSVWCGIMELILLPSLPQLLRVSCWFSARLESWLFSHRVFLCRDSIRQHEFHIYKIFEHCILFNISLASISVGEFSEFTVRNTIWCLKSSRKTEIHWWWWWMEMHEEIDYVTGSWKMNLVCAWIVSVSLFVLKMAAQYLCESLGCNSRLSHSRRQSCVNMPLGWGFYLWLNTFLILGWAFWWQCCATYCCCVIIVTLFVRNTKAWSRLRFPPLFSILYIFFVFLSPSFSLLNSLSCSAFLLIFCSHPSPVLFSLSPVCPSSPLRGS